VKDAPPLVRHGGDDEEVHGDEGLKVVVEKDFLWFMSSDF
jgi:hypothetical protein